MKKTIYVIYFNDFTCDSLPLFAVSSVKEAIADVKRLNGLTDSERYVYKPLDLFV